MRPLLLLPAALAALLSAGPAYAHLSLEEPESRYGANVLKFGPCGMTGGTRSNNVRTYTPGETIEVRWNEYVNHPGHFRVSFDDDGDDDFVDPPCLADCNNGNMEIELYSSPTVLLDDIPDTNGGDTTVMITLPNIECDNCTLQAIQIMTDKPPYTLPGNDIYYQCADLILAGPIMMPDAGTADAGDDPRDGGVVVGMDAAPPGMDATPMAGMDAAPMGGNPDASVTADVGEKEEDDGGCTCVRRSESSLGALLLLGALFLVRRRR